MKVMLQIVSLIGLALVFVPSLAYLAGVLDKTTMTTIMLIGTLVWFASAPFWMGWRQADRPS